jgi:hypothetical protein
MLSASHLALDVRNILTDSLWTFGSIAACPPWQHKWTANHKYCRFICITS